MLRHLSASLAILMFGLVIFPNSANAQQPIPNSGFETWMNTTYGEVPAGSGTIHWNTNDSLVATLGGSTVSKAVKKVTDAHSGNYALCLQESYIYIPANNYKDSGGSVVVLGDLNLNTFKPIGVPYTSRPSSLNGYYKITALHPGADTAEINIRFKIGGSDLAAGAKQFTTTTNGYQPFSIPITWATSQNPDVLQLAMTNGGVDVISNDTSTRFYVDDLSFGYPTGVQESIFPDDNIRTYPNPSSDKVTIWLADSYLDGKHFITVLDIQGKVVARIDDLKTTQTLPLLKFGRGIYFIQLHDATSIIYGSRISVTQ